MKLFGVNTRIQKMTIAALCLGSAFFVQGCSYREAMSGKHEDTVSGHQITVVKPCSLFTENTTRIENVPGHARYEYTCGQTKVAMVLTEELTVNNKSYGKLNEGDAVAFDNGKVLINSQEVREVASR